MRTVIRSVAASGRDIVFNLSSQTLYSHYPLALGRGLASAGSR